LVVGVKYSPDDHALVAAVLELVDLGDELDGVIAGIREQRELLPLGARAEYPPSPVLPRRNPFGSVAREDTI